MYFFFILCDMSLEVWTIDAAIHKIIWKIVGNAGLRINTRIYFEKSIVETHLRNRG